MRSGYSWRLVQARRPKRGSRRMSYELGVRFTRIAYSMIGRVPPKIRMPFSFERAFNEGLLTLNNRLAAWKGPPFTTGELNWFCRLKRGNVHLDDPRVLKRHPVGRRTRLTNGAVF
jgi:hypothetical protein